MPLGEQMETAFLSLAISRFFLSHTRLLPRARAKFEFATEKNGTQNWINTIATNPSAWYEEQKWKTQEVFRWECNSSENKCFSMLTHYTCLTILHFSR